MDRKLYVFILLLVSQLLTAQTFTKHTHESYPNFNDIFFVSDQVGWAVSDRDFYSVTKLPVILKTTDAGETWFKQSFNEDDLYDTFLRSVFFMNENKGFVGGDHDILMVTTDGGENWVKTTVSNLDGSVKEIYFANETTGWIRLSKSSGARVLHTTDGGENWTSVLQVSKDLYSMSFAGLNVGVVSGKSKDDIYYTRDGVTWVNAETEDYGDYIYSKTNLNGVYMLDENFVYGVGWGSASAGLQPTIFVKSTNGGETWKYLDQKDANKIYVNMYALHFENGLNGLAFGGGVQYGSVVLKTTDSGKNWVPQDIPFGFSIKAVASAGSRVFAVGGGGNIIYTDDMGETWVSTTPMPGASIYNITFPSVNTGYAAGFDGLMLKTTDGGSTWIPKYVSHDQRCPKVNDLHFVNDNTGYFARAYGMISKTTDGGESWTTIRECQLSSLTSIYAVDFLNENFGIITGRTYTDEEIIYKTTDGTTFEDITGNFFDELYDVKILDENNIVFVGDDLLAAYSDDGCSTFKYAPVTGASPDDSTEAFNRLDIKGDIGLAVGNNMIFKTSDAGKSWFKSLTDSVDVTFENIYLVDETRYYVVGEDSVYHTTDGGSTWFNIADNTVIDRDLKGITWESTSNAIWLCGNNTNIYSGESPYVVSVEMTSPAIPEKFELSQNYPNPFNPETTIKYSIPTEGKVSLNIHNALGELVAELINNRQAAGSYSVEFNAEGLSSGIYYYSLNFNGKTNTSKMVLLK